MTWISTSYDSGTLNIQSYTKILDKLNQHTLKIKKDEVAESTRDDT
jgi:hypothetical protein